MVYWPRVIPECVGIADAVSRCEDLQSAFDQVALRLSRALSTRTCILRSTPRGWMVVGQARGGLQLSLADLQTVLSGVSVEPPTATLELHGAGRWMSLALDCGDTPTVLLLCGEWGAAIENLDVVRVVLSLAIQAVGARDDLRRTKRLSRDAYAIVRRLGRMGGLERVCQRAVTQLSQSLKVDRVALALYRADEDRLVIAATHGYSAALVKDVRIEPGSWVIGQVYASGRAVLVQDVRVLGSRGTGRRDYRTSSFGVVPMRVGTKTIGVLSATDKRDGSAFDWRDGMALRTFAVSVGLALVAARNDTEVHRLAFAATVDSLTELFNRPYFDVRLHQELERAKRSSTSLTLMLADVDDFKKINDTYGHQGGDAVLRLVGKVLRSTVRVFDVSARYGGDEFAILMPTSDRATAAACAERVRQRVSAATEASTVGGPARFTLSIGVAVIAPGDTPADLMRRADQCLYKAKAMGKNQVCGADEPEFPRVYQLGQGPTESK